MEELVSIIMPNYNSAKYLKETLDSILHQTYQKWELLFVDDFSTDESIKIFKEYQQRDDRFMLFINDKNCGAAFSRNFALQKANGKFVAFLDSDDVWYLDKLEKQINFMNKHNYLFTYSGYEQISEDSSLLGVYIKGPQVINRKRMLHFNYIGCLTAMYRRDAIGLIQVNENLSSKNDYAIWLQVSKISPAYFLDECLAKYRVRNRSVSHGSLKKSLSNQYRLFRIGESKNCFISFFFTFRNIIFSIIKKALFVHKGEHYEK